MKLNREAIAKYIIEEGNLGSRTSWEMLMTLIEHFEHSFKHIKSYEGLTHEEQEYIPEHIFEEITKCS